MVGALLLSVGAAGAGCHRVTVAEQDRLAVYDVEPWRQVLAGTVRDGLVDYRALRESFQPPLDIYLDAAARLGPRYDPEQFPTAQDKLAFYLNTYNALMLRQWLNGGAGEDDRDRSVNLLWFMVPQWRVDATWMSLNTLEQSVIRPTFRDPRIHFALVCGAVSCPPLLNEPFEGPRLDEQLDEQGRRWLEAGSDGLVIDADGTVRFSQIFMWYLPDFDDWGGLAGVVDRYVPANDARRTLALEALASGAAQWLPYDWSINDSSVRSPVLAAAR